MPSNEKERHTRVVQISNISPSANREQIKHMFGYFGNVDEMKVYPSETNPMYSSAQSKMCYIKFDDSGAVAAAQHMTNTVFIDRALICVPVPEGRIPDEEKALKTGGPALPGQRQLPPNVINQIQLVGSQQLMVTIDPTLASLGLPDYPPLPANTDATKIEEIRRTIYVGNIPKDTKTEDVLDFFNDKIGEVMYLRMAGDDDLPIRYAYVEFTSQHSVPTALQNNGIEFNGSKLRVQHSTVAIIKPRAKTQDMAKKEVEEAMKKVEAANPTLTKGVDSSDELLRRFANSRSPSRKRTRSRSRPRRSRSRSPSRKRISRNHRSRSPFRRRSRSGDRKRKSRSKSIHRSRSNRRSRSPSRKKSEATRDRTSKESSSAKDSGRKPERESKDKKKERSTDEKKRGKSSERERKEGESSSRRVKVEKKEELNKSEDNSFKEPDTKDDRNKKSKDSSKESRHHRRRDQESSDRKSVTESPSSSRIKLEPDLSKSAAECSPLLAAAVEKTPSSVTDEKVDEDSFIDEMLEKTHVKKEKKKKEKKEKKKKREKLAKKKKSSDEDDDKDSMKSLDE